MKNSKKHKDTDQLLGHLSRKRYLDVHPHGYASTHKIHPSKKKYNRKRLQNNKKIRPEE